MPSNSPADNPLDSTSSAPSLVIGAAFTLDDSQAPNLKTMSRRNVYWQNIAVMMATARMFAPAGAELIVFSTDPPTKEAAPILAAVDANIVDTPFQYRPPKNFYHAFNGAFYLLDAMNWCAANRAKNCDYLFLDPDCVMTGDINAMQATLRTSDIIAYELPYRRDWRNSGLLHDDLCALCREFSGRADTSGVKQYGGELYAFNATGLQQLTSALPEVWEANLARFAAGKAKFNTEEHLISYLFWRDAPRIYDAKGRFVKRFWTGTRYRNYRKGEEALPVWHLPAEKDRGIPRIFKDIETQKFGLTSTDREKTKRYLASSLGLQGDWSREICFRFLSMMGKSWQGLP
ncbi:hypothetical protein [Defluviicoccus vanus]|uniref:Uncharacterized protein n=1 Tax=Defluviicoccus vanus TaxID=111831 RepID=A0A7H1N4W1_9PROT|nr:hypothetical protein [Defluviicoccus vanus]QNT70747.1 hypothetical protein HQ394_17220 [Defluviicoccus vanus]